MAARRRGLAAPGQSSLRDALEVSHPYYRWVRGLAGFEPATAQAPRNQSSSGTSSFPFASDLDRCNRPQLPTPVPRRYPKLALTRLFHYSATDLPGPTMYPAFPTPSFQFLVLPVFTQKRNLLDHRTLVCGQPNGFGQRRRDGVYTRTTCSLRSRSTERTRVACTQVSSN